MMPAGKRVMQLCRQARDRDYVNQVIKEFKRGSCPVIILDTMGLINADCSGFSELI